MLGLLSLFGRSREYQRLDHALRGAGLHPRLVPDAVKLTVLKLLKDVGGSARPGPDDCASAADMLAYCMLGPEGFAEANGLDRTTRVEARLEASLESGESLDARLVLLALHSGVIESQVVERYALRSV